MRTTLTTKMYCRPSKADKSGKAPIELSIIVNGERTFFNLPYPKTDPAVFNRKRRPKDLQEYCDSVQANIINIILDMTRNGIPVTASNLKHYISTGGVKSYTVGMMFTEVLGLLKKKIGIDMNERTYRKYEIVRDLFLRRVSADSEVTAITPSVMQEFYLDLQKEYTTASAGAYFTRIKTMVKHAMDNGHLNINPFQGIKVRYERKPIDYLTDEEIETLRNAKIDNESLCAVRDAFLLQVFSGLSYIDLEHLKEDDIKVSSDGTHYIQKQRVKTGVTFTSVILPEGVEILMRNGYKMKVISNQKMNLFLKQVAALAGLNHTLRTHLGRKTYGHILLNRGVRMDVVAKTLGHSSAKTTARYYAEVMPDTVISEVATAIR